MKEIVEVIAKAIVDNPDEVVVTEREEGRNLVIELKVAQESATRPPLPITRVLSS